MVGRRLWSPSPRAAKNPGGVARRDVLAGTGLLLAALSADEAPAAVASNPAAAPIEPMWTLNATEQAFIAAAVDIFIPGDALSPSASDCGVVTFIDRQLAGAWGSGARLYRSGPFLKGKPEHGYQLPLTPREYFAAGIAAVNRWTAANHGGAFDALADADRVASLRALESGKAELDDLSGADFFDALLAITMEGFFADPIYGGNRDKAAWAMIGYPGLPATYAVAITDYRGRPYRAAPKSIADFL
jgi:gluconate 2-dehydrogenase gamma chain